MRRTFCPAPQVWSGTPRLSVDIQFAIFCICMDINIEFFRCPVQTPAHAGVQGASPWDTTLMLFNFINML